MIGGNVDRFLMEDLIKWKRSKRRKPLILNGARQVGKTWLLKEFGRTQFDNVAYVSFDDNPLMAAAFNEGTAHTLPTAIAMAEGKGKPEDHPKEFVGRRTHDSVIVGFAMLGGSYDPAIITFAMMLTRAQLDEEAWRKSRAEERETTASAGGRYVVIS